MVYGIEKVHHREGSIPATLCSCPAVRSTSRVRHLEKIHLFHYVGLVPPPHLNTLPLPPPSLRAVTQVHSFIRP